MRRNTPSIVSKARNSYLLSCSSEPWTTPAETFGISTLETSLATEGCHPSSLSSHTDFRDGFSPKHSKSFHLLSFSGSLPSRVYLCGSLRVFIGSYWDRFPFPVPRKVSYTKSREKVRPFRTLFGLQCLFSYLWLRRTRNETRSRTCVWLRTISPTVSFLHLT